MGYATQQDLIDRFGEQELIQLTDRVATPPATIDATIVTRALDDATALIDGYLLSVYALPLPSVPPVAVKFASDIARFFLWGDRADPKGQVAESHMRAIAWLRDVSRGLIKLEIEGAVAPAAPQSGARFSGSEPTFTRRNLRSM